MKKNKTNMCSGSEDSSGRGVTVFLHRLFLRLHCPRSRRFVLPALAAALVFLSFFPSSAYEALPENGTGASSGLNVMVQDVSHRYAVDLTFPEMTLSFDAVKWNVDSGLYEIQGSGYKDREPALISITVTNHSDMRVTAYAETSVSPGAEDGLLFSTPYEAANGIVVRSALPADTVGSVFAELPIEICPRQDRTWSDVLSELISNGSMEPMTGGGYGCSVGTVRVYIEQI